MRSRAENIMKALEVVKVDIENGIVYGQRGFQCKKKNNYGYLVYTLYLEGEKPIYLQQHYLVAYAGGLEVPEGMTINHIDGNKLNNRFDNLEVISRGENIKHAWKTGINDRQKKIPDSDFPLITEYQNNGMSYSQIAKIYGTTKQTVYRTFKRGNNIGK